jgi:hypothetical protein
MGAVQRDQAVLAQPQSVSVQVATKDSIDQRLHRYESALSFKRQGTSSNSLLMHLNQSSSSLFNTSM